MSNARQRAQARYTRVLAHPHLDLSGTTCSDHTWITRTAQVKAGLRRSERAQRAQLLEDACGRGQQLLVPPKQVVQVHVNLQVRKCARRGSQQYVAEQAPASSASSCSRSLKRQGAVAACAPAPARAAGRRRRVAWRPPTCTVALLPGASLSLMRTIWLRRMRGSFGGVVSLKVVCEAGRREAGYGAHHMGVEPRFCPGAGRCVAWAGSRIGERAALSEAACSRTAVKRPADAMRSKQGQAKSNKQIPGCTQFQASSPASRR